MFRCQFFIFLFLFLFTPTNTLVEQYEFSYNNTLGIFSDEEVRKGIEERKLIMTDYVLNEQRESAKAIPLYVSEGIDFNMSVLFEDMVELMTNDIPDFHIASYLRILFNTTDFDNILLPAIAQNPMWLRKGEIRVIHWTENHHILFTCLAYLLRQTYKDHFPEEYFDDGLDERLDWILRTKQEYTLFEFNSPIYFTVSLRGFLLLFDFAEDERIREEARKCAFKIVGDWLKHTNSAGVSAVSSGRTYPTRYYQDVEMFGPGYQQVVYLLTGLGPFVKDLSPLADATIDLLLTNLDFVDIIRESYSTEEFFEVNSVGAVGQDFFSPLEGEEKSMAQLTMGGFVHPDYINTFYNIVNEYDMFEHNVIGSDGELLKLMAFPWMRTAFSTAVSSLTSGSLLKTEIALYKNEGVMLTSCQNYASGFKGYQQISGVGVIWNTSVFTYSSVEANYRDIAGAYSQRGNNNQMPFMIQRSNVQVALYNPNLDLGLLGISNRDVRFYMDYKHFEEICTQEKWIFAKLEENYVAVYRHCLNDTDDHEYTMCAEQMQAWITVVGNDHKYTNLETFVKTIEGSIVQISQSFSCISLVGVIDGQTFNESFCRNLGNGLTVLILLVLVFVLLIAGCVYCFRKCCCTTERVVKKIL